MFDRSRSLSDCDFQAGTKQIFQSKIVQPRRCDSKYNHPVQKKDATFKSKEIPNEITSVDEYRFGPMIGKNLQLRQVFQKMAKMAPSNAGVIIYGESGTGKELAAQTIHNLSSRRNNRFVPVNCGAIPVELIESEFFGFTKGAFTGAAMNKLGYLDWADKGTLFLDEIGELSLSMQVKLLRAVDGGGFTPIGSQEIKKPDIRIIAATNRDLRETVRKGLMREDFFYRINVLQIQLPPLRERKDDLPLLINHFLARFSRGQTLPVIPESLKAGLEAYDWPGNIRELQNTIQRYVTLKEIDFLKPLYKNAKPAQFTRPAFRFDQDLKSALEEVEKQYIFHCLKATNWHMGKASAALKINRKTLYTKMQRYGLKKK